MKLTSRDGSPDVLVPLLALGLPTSATAAILLAEELSATKVVAAVTGGRYFGVSQPGDLLAALVAITTAERRLFGIVDAG